MKTLILILLFYATSFAQDFMLLMGSSGYYSYVFVNVGATVSDDQIIFSGASTRTKTTKALGDDRAAKRYMRWGEGNALTDSVSGYSKVLSTITEDTFYVYSQSGFYIKKESGDTVWNAADLDTTYSILYPVPAILTVVPEDTSIIITWWQNSTITDGYTLIERSVNNISYSVIDSVLMTILTFTDTTTLSGTKYYYRLRNHRYTYSSYCLVDSATTDVIQDEEGIYFENGLLLGFEDGNVAVFDVEDVDSIPILTPLAGFTPVTDAVASGYYISNGVALSDFDSAYTYCAGDSFKVGNLGTLDVGYVKVFPDDTVYVSCVASASPETAVRKILTIGTVIDTFMVTTAAAPSFPTVESWTEVAVITTTVDSMRLGKPANVAVGDLLIILAANDASGGAGQWTNLPTGFTKINESGNVTEDCFVAAWYRVADGTEADSITVKEAGDGGTYMDKVGWYIRVTGANASTPLDAAGSDSNIGGTGNDSLTITSVNATTDNCLAFYIMGFDGGDAGGFTASGTGWTESDEKNAGTGASNGSGSWGTKEIASAGATGDVIISWTAVDGATGFQFIIKP